MTNLEVKIVNVETGEEIIREMTAEEVSQHEVDKLNAQTEEKSIEIKEQQRKELFERLGINEDEAKLLLS